MLATPRLSKLIYFHIPLKFTSTFSIFLLYHTLIHMVCYAASWMDLPYS